MSIENAREYYLKIKDYFNEDLFNNFYTYFEQTWLNLDENEVTRAKVCALFHDLGRFPQFSEYKTFRSLASQSYPLSK